MVKKRVKPKTSNRLVRNQRRDAASFQELLNNARKRTQEQSNQRSGKRALRSVQAAIAATDWEEDDEELHDWPQRFLRWGAALVLLPICWVTSWTLLARFSQATVYQHFWRTREFWYFATGVLMMIGWFASGLLRKHFLYLYVLGHELTHAVFVMIYRGRVSDYDISSDGGYITTNKTNLVISLSPYFFPFWAVVTAALYAICRYSWSFSGETDRFLYALLGLTWTFHMVWTLWMIPRDQPDLKENGTFFSLVIIYLANVLVLVLLLCLASQNPIQNMRDFALEWVRHAATWVDILIRWGKHSIESFRVSARF
jgi:hypothetical protein